MYDGIVNLQWNFACKFLLSRHINIILLLTYVLFFRHRKRLKTDILFGIPNIQFFANFKTLTVNQTSLKHTVLIITLKIKNNFTN